MLQTNNTTPFQAMACPAQDKDGNSLVLTVIKATYTFSEDGRVSLADEQAPICLVDEYYGDVKTSSLRYASDIVPEKKGTDIALNGHAYAPGGKPVRKLNAGISVGDVTKIVAVWGDRCWQIGMGVLSKSKPLPFVRMPMVWERAFGGEDRVQGPEKKWGYCMENPIGTGFRLRRTREALEGLALPNLEDPVNPLRSWKDKPVPAGFGFIPPYWEPRCRLSGTFDKAWEENRMPLLPRDFDTGFYNASVPDLIHRPYLRGHEKVRLLNLHPSRGEVSFDLPGSVTECAFIFKHQTYKRFPVLDTLIIEPDENRFILVLRCRFTADEKLHYLKRVNVYEKE